jgi:hypothetical protein
MKQHIPAGHPTEPGSPPQVSPWVQQLLCVAQTTPVGPQGYSLVGGGGSFQPGAQAEQRASASSAAAFMASPGRAA